MNVSLLSKITNRKDNKVMYVFGNMDVGVNNLNLSNHGN